MRTYLGCFHTIPGSFLVWYKQQRHRTETSISHAQYTSNIMPGRLADLGLLTCKSKRQNDTLIFGCSLLRVAWIAHQLFFRERGRREVGVALSNCKRGWSLEIEELCQEIVRNEVEDKVSKMFSSPIVAGHFAILRRWLPLLRRGIISLFLLSSAHRESLWLLLQIRYLHSCFSRA